MSHIDEGELTAYADGAYAPEEADAQRIGAHIAECVNCRNRLVQAQALSAQASTILAVASPRTRAVPPFEQIAANASPVKRRRAVPLSWAASIVLAAGLGWFGRDALYNPDAGLRTSSPAVDAQDAAAPAAAAPAPTAPRAGASAGARVGAGAGVESAGAGAPAAGARVGGVLPPEPSVRAESDLAAADVVAETSEQRAVTGNVAGVAAADHASSRVADARSKSVAAATAPPPPALQSAPAPAPALAPALAPASRAERQSAASASGAEVGTHIEYITAAQAEARNLTLHIVPELEIVRIGIAGTEVRVEQKLPDGRIVTVTSNAQSGNRQQDAANGADSSKQGEASITVSRGAKRITISASLPADSLRALSAKVR